MRIALFSKLCLGLVVVSAFFNVASEAVPPVKADESASKPITASGCVTSGVEGGCLMVTDAKTGTVYNVYFRGGKKPKVGTAIRFTGTPHDGVTMCMQGQAVNVRSWIQLKKKCPAKTTEVGGC